jgi:SSS family solute:Na+ symporter
VVLSAQFTKVLDAILYAYAFMVAGLFVPTMGAYFWQRGSSTGAIAAMIGGGTVTLLLLLDVIMLPDALSALGLDAAVYGIVSSLVLYVGTSLVFPDRKGAR